MVKGWSIVAALLLSLALVGSIACNPLGGSEPETRQQLVEVVRGDLAITVSASGKIEVARDIKLAFGIGGRVDKIYVEENDEVSKGEVLARLETDALELALTQAQVTVAEAEVAVTRTETAVTQAQVALQTAEYERDLAVMLSDSDTAEVAIKKRQVEAAQQSLEATKQSLELAKQSLEATGQSLELAKLSPELARQSLELARQSLEQAQKQLDKTTLVAPFAGVVARLYDVEEGDTISPATTILYLVDPSVMALMVQVDELDIPEVKLGQRAIIEVDALPALPLTGKVSSISLLPTVEAGVIAYDVKIDFALPAGVGLRAGMSATTDIIINERSNILLVPNRAINRDSQGNPVVEVMVNGQIEPRAVVTGISNDLQTEIVQGLNEGEKVVIEKKVKP